MKNLSIITVCFNAEKTIRSTIESVIKHKEPVVEYIIIDGNSSDNTKSIIEEYKSQVDIFISEPDRGIYDAMNKGVSKATGEWLYFLGSDDILEAGALEKILPYLSDTYKLVYGDVCYDNGWRYPSFLNQRIIFQNTVHHQGAFYHNTLFREFHYDTKLRILSDYELNLRIYLHRLPVKRVPFIVACCFQGGASSEFSLSIKETNIVRARYIKGNVNNWLLSGLLKLYYLQKQVRIFLFK